MTWNLRDQHMVRMLNLLLRYHDEKRKKAGLQGPARCVVWAHNSHLGDCRATGLARQGEWNVGQLVREKWGLDQCFSVGFTTYTGTVSAAEPWGGERKSMTLNPALPNSYERLFHQLTVADQKESTEDTTTDVGSSPETAHANFVVLLRSAGSAVPCKAAVEFLERPRRLERAVGIQYVKRTERQSHYIECCLPKQFDAVIHCDKTHALVESITHRR